MARTKTAAQGLPAAKLSALAAFATQLRAWRLKQELTQEQLGEAIGFSAALVSMIENSSANPQADFAAACDGLFGTPATFATLQGLVSREAFPSYFAPVVPLETGADRIHGWELCVVPGLLQTREYAEALFRMIRPHDTSEAIEDQVSKRMERQAILSRPPKPPRLWYVLDESALRRVVGDASIMAAQLKSLCTLMLMPGIVIQVLPYTAECPGTDGPLAVFEFDDRPTVCYTECHAGGRVVEEHGEVAELATIMTLLKASALSPRESAAFVQKLGDRYESGELA